jgi:hypothetical protein
LAKKAEAEQAAEQDGDEEKKNFQQYFLDMNEDEIQIEPDLIIDPQIESIFGRKIALSFNALDWKYKEMAMKLIYKQTDKYFDVQNKNDHQTSI